MDCAEARERIFESLAGDPAAAGAADFENHLMTCDACRSFLEEQLRLDAQLRAAIHPPASPGFRKSMMRRIRREPLRAWPEWLPDVAHVLGCLSATVVCVLVLPFGAAPIVGIGVSFTVATYFLQIAIRSSLEAWEEERQ